MHTICKFSSFVLVAMASTSCGKIEHVDTVNFADRVFTNSQVYTVNAQRSWAQAVAVSDGRIVFVGDNESAANWIGPDTEITDLAGQMLLPGFHDSHIHIMIGVMDDDECDLLRLPTAKDVADQLETCTELTGLGNDGWIIGGGWGEWLWPEANPQKDSLDLLFPDRPVYLGDAGIRMALDGFEALRESNGESEKRHQIVHLQLIHEEDRPRFGELDIGAVFQSLWSYPDPAVIELDVPMIGEERTWKMYPTASVQKAGGRIVGGSDYFVTDLNPLHAIEAAITRQDPYSNDGPVLNKNERVDLATMIDAYTIQGAYQMSLEDEQGSIEVGKRADLVVLDRNLFEISPSEINEARVMMTIFNGRTVYE